MKPLCAIVELKIPFFDVDPMGIVWHGNYAKYFELARCEMLQHIDYGYTRMADSGYYWPIVDMRVKYIKPCRFDQEIAISAEMVEFENRLKIDYKITDKLSHLVHTKAHSIQVAVSIETGEMCYVSPPILAARIEEYSR
jgi:acyl-CoA thioester hydrolase